MSIHGRLSWIQDNILKHFKRKEIEQIEPELENHMKVTVIMSPPPVIRKGKQSPCEKIRTLSRKLTIRRSIRKSSREKENRKREQEWSGFEGVRKNNDLSSYMKIHLPCDGMFFAELPLFKLLNPQQKEIVINVEGLKLEIYVLKHVDKADDDGNQSEATSKKDGKEVKIRGKNAVLKKKKKEMVGEAGVIEERSITDEDLELHGHIILPMYIETQTLEFSIDEGQSFQIQANIKGAISVSPSTLGFREVLAANNKSRKASLAERLVSGSPLLRHQVGNKWFSNGPVVKRQTSSPGAFKVSPTNSPRFCPLPRHLSMNGESGSLNASSCPNSPLYSPFLFARRLNGSRTSEGVFRPSESLNRKGSKKKARKNSCRWELELPRPRGEL